MRRLLVSHARASAIRGLLAAGALMGAGLIVGCSGPPAIPKAETPPAKGAALSAEQQRVFDAWKQARAAYDQQLSRYWAQIDEKRSGRRAKRRGGIAYTADDYLPTPPPQYDGPGLPKSIADIAFPPTPDGDRAKDQIPTIEQALTNARTHFGFTPERTSEAEFKRRYAEEALALGLTKEQVIRVYALETGGQGTYDMQAGINPITRKGTPISTALGYAQLLAANSVNEIVDHGARYEQRLLQMAAASAGNAERASALSAKAAIVRRMRAHAMTVPNEWSAQVELSRQDKGFAIHALNIDADVGPWLQVQKLASLAELAAKNGRPQLAGNEIELMNLAGPATGLEMMEPVGRTMPTANFFSRRGYERNTIVRGRTAAELLQALDQRMDVNERKDGAVEFARIFDQVIAARRGSAARVATE